MYSDQRARTIGGEQYTGAGAHVATVCAVAVIALFAHHRVAIAGESEHGAAVGTIAQREVEVRQARRNDVQCGGRTTAMGSRISQQ
ncbi:hypothetical protein AF72_08045 [Xylella taiwanensis]|uniref:Uncharacterized protein n=1 Tax=Xylella taiwanensis TaxID=1444770 RepID=Z9JJD9_9GAMM|nr:hypothetical protein AF72_08045 [Xylella taiwanensis]